MNNLRTESSINNNEKIIFIKNINETKPTKNSNGIVIYDVLNDDLNFQHINKSEAIKNSIVFSRNTHAKITSKISTDDTGRNFTSQHIDGNFTNTPSETDVFEVKKNAIFNMIKNESVDPGYYTSAEVEIKKLLKSEPLKVKDWICQIFYENFSDKNLLLKILYILSDIDYDHLKPQGPLIAVACASHLDEEVQEFSIRMFENWSNVESLELLRSIKYQVAWLNEYAQEVISDIEGE